MHCRMWFNMAGYSRSPKWLVLFGIFLSYRSWSSFQTTWFWSSSCFPWQDALAFLIEIEGHMGSFFPHVMCVSYLIGLLWKLQLFCSSVTLEKAAACQWKLIKIKEEFLPQCDLQFSVKPGNHNRKKHFVLLCPGET